MEPGHSQLGQFIIIEPLGEGGMGFVYKARDTRLDRVVAIKVLPADAVADPERQRRFAQEAKAASALNHPNIVTIYDINDEQGVAYIAMEFVDGRRLDEVIPPKGMPLSEALRISVQIASALSAAHAAGIVHRDLKPANIMVTPHGQVKVLDFGLAKLVAPESRPPDETRTFMMGSPATQHGMIVGSAPYMSPEQAEGKPVDARSDIFSFGAVLYEMITGERAFHGDSGVATLAAILAKEPRPMAELAAVPQELERLVSRCLRKELDRRTQSMSDVRLALEELRDDSQSGMRSMPGPAGPSRRSLWIAAAAITAIVFAALAATWLFGNRAPALPVQPELTRLSASDGFTDQLPAISPDGKFVAFTSDRGTGRQQLWLQQVGGAGDPIQLTRFEGESVFSPEFSPDGTSIVYNRMPSLAIETIPTLGGLPRRIAEFAVLPRFSPDGKRIAYIDVRNGGTDLMVIPRDGGEPEAIKTYDADAHGRPALWLPGGTHILTFKEAAGAPTEWYAVPVASGPAIPMKVAARFGKAGIQSAIPTAAAGNRIFFTVARGDQQNAWEIRIKTSSWKADSAPRPLTFGTASESINSVSGTGVAALQVADFNSDLYFIPMDVTRGQVTGPARRLTRDSRHKGPFSIGTSGSNLLGWFKQANRAGYFAKDLDTGKETQVLGASAGERMNRVVGSPDGHQFVFERPEGKSFSMTVASLRAPGASLSAPRPLCKSCGHAMMFAPDSRYLFYDPGATDREDPNRKAALHLLDTETGEGKVWLALAGYSLRPVGRFGEKSQWIVLEASANSKLVSRFIVPWTIEPPPESAVIDVTSALAPYQQMRQSSGSDLFFVWDKEDLLALRYNAGKQRFDEPRRVEFRPGSTPSIKATDRWDIGGKGIFFVHSQDRGEIWLMKLPAD